MALTRSSIVCRHIARVVSRRSLSLGKSAVVGSRNFCVSSSLRSKDGKERIKDNPFFDKYREKLSHVIPSEGDKIDGGRTDAEQPTTSANYSSSQKVSFTQPPNLKDVMHVEKIFDKTAEEITEIWKQYHADKDKIFAVIPSNVYSKMYQLSQQCPLFVYPLPRSQGYEMMFSQFSGHRCYLTSLLLYKRHQENAPPCLTLSHYIDLMDSKGIVLMSGEVDTKMISVIDAQYLANQVQLYYITEENGRCSLLRAFNHSQEEFDYTKLFEHLQSGIESQQK